MVCLRNISVDALHKGDTDDDDDDDDASWIELHFEKKMYST